MILDVLVFLFGPIWNIKNLTVNHKVKALRSVYKLLYKLYQRRNCSSIAWNSSFEGEPCFPHGMKSIFISGDANIGRDCVIFQQVVVGSVVLLDSSTSGSPVIGNNCYIGAGAKIIGNVKVGDNVRIGANTVVYKDVPDNCVVVSAIQQNIQKIDTLDNKFYSSPPSWQTFENGHWNKIKDSAVLSSLNRILDEK